MKYKSSFKIRDREISIDAPTYFIADIAANHDGDLARAKDLIWRAKEAGSDAVKFQHFRAEKIVSDFGFKNLGQQASHQAGWKSSVFDTFRKYEFNREWNEALATEAKKASIHFMTTPYDTEAVEEIDHLVPAYKIGSGDITWTDFISYVAKKKKPMVIACGASNLDEVKRGVAAALEFNEELALLQCNTNYTGKIENFRFVNLQVIKSLAKAFPNLVLGLSDHTPGHATVLGAIALGGRVIEKHFTDDNSREGPDHPFSMNPKSWREMVDRSRELEASMGDGIKRVEENELETVVLQRRSLRLKADSAAGAVILAQELEALRPAPVDSIPPSAIREVAGQKLLKNKVAGDYLRWSDLGKEEQ